MDRRANRPAGKRLALLVGRIIFGRGTVASLMDLNEERKLQQGRSRRGRGTTLVDQADWPLPQPHEVSDERSAKLLLDSTFADAAARTSGSLRRHPIGHMS